MSVIKARKLVVSFFISELGYEKDAVQVLGIKKIEAGWEAKVIVTETNRHLKKLGYPPVYDKNIYFVNLDQDLEIVSYWTGECSEGED